MKGCKSKVSKFETKPSYENHIEYMHFSAGKRAIAVLSFRPVLRSVPFAGKGSYPGCQPGHTGVSQVLQIGVGTTGCTITSIFRMLTKTSATVLLNVESYETFFIPVPLCPPAISFQPVYTRLQSASLQ
jgi:hypothetical protein